MEGEVGQGHAPQGDARQQAPSCLGYPVKERAPTGSRMLRSVYLPPARGASSVNEREKVSDIKDQIVYLNLDKLKVDTTKRINTRQGQERRHQRLVGFFK